MSYSRTKHREAWSKIVAKAWLDEDFKKKLLKDPKKVMNENGMELPENIKVKLYEDDEKHVSLTIPQKPTEDEISEEDLKKTAGGSPAPGTASGGDTTCTCN